VVTVRAHLAHGPSIAFCHLVCDPVAVSNRDISIVSDCRSTFIGQLVYSTLAQLADSDRRGEASCANGRGIDHYTLGNRESSRRATSGSRSHAVIELLVNPSTTMV
jgi:hypothetical protein